MRYCRRAGDVVFLSAFIFITCAVFLSPVASANNLQIAAGSIVDYDTSADTAVIQFDISWDNSWRDAINYDAAWVFIKYSTTGGTGVAWSHATLSEAGTNPSSFSTGSGTAIDIIVPSDKKGCFIQRKNFGTGSVDTDDIQVVWNYGFDGVSDSDIPDMSLKIFGIEMVYVPEGPFDVGDGNGTSEATYALHITNNTKFQINTVMQNNVTVDSNIYDTIDTTPIDIDGDDGIDTNGNGNIDNALYPTGYTAFYMMKYEITQGQYADFLNSLDSDAAGNRYPNKNGSVRHTISVSGSRYSASRPDRACNYLSWMDVCAYADWAALRPMTELEYEKGARGAAASGYGEYPWGSTTYNNAATGEISGTENGTEYITDTSANVSAGAVTYTSGDNGYGPLRAGIFAMSSTTTRVTTGAGYYGAMELGGNVYERCVSVGRNVGLTFLGTHGDGTLETGITYGGNATNSDWPGFTSGQGVSTNNGGGGLRGGNFMNSSGATSYLQLSNRALASSTDSTRGYTHGGRCARTAP